MAGWTRHERLESLARNPRAACRPVRTQADQTAAPGIEVGDSFPVTRVVPTPLADAVAREAAPSAAPLVLGSNSPGHGALLAGTACVQRIRPGSPSALTTNAYVRIGRSHQPCGGSGEPHRRSQRNRTASRRGT
jgi:hypothetical protein